MSTRGGAEERAEQVLERLASVNGDAQVIIVGRHAMGVEPLGGIGRAILHDFAQAFIRQPATQADLKTRGASGSDGVITAQFSVGVSTVEDGERRTITLGIEHHDFTGDVGRSPEVTNLPKSSVMGTTAQPMTAVDVDGLLALPADHLKTRQTMLLLAANHADDLKAIAHHLGSEGRYWPFDRTQKYAVHMQTAPHPVCQLDPVAAAVMSLELHGNSIDESVTTAQYVAQQLDALHRSGAIESLRRFLYDDRQPTLSVDAVKLLHSTKRHFDVRRIEAEQESSGPLAWVRLLAETDQNLRRSPSRARVPVSGRELVLLALDHWRRRETPDDQQTLEAALMLSQKGILPLCPNLEDAVRAARSDDGLDQLVAMGALERRFRATLTAEAMKQDRALDLNG